MYVMHQKMNAAWTAIIAARARPSHELQSCFAFMSVSAAARCPQRQELRGGECRASKNVNQPSTLIRPRTPSGRGRLSKPELFRRSKPRGKVVPAGPIVPHLSGTDRICLVDQGYGNGDLRLRLMQLNFYLRSVANAIIAHEHTIDVSDAEVSYGRRLSIRSPSKCQNPTRQAKLN